MVTGGLGEAALVKPYSFASTVETKCRGRIGILLRRRGVFNQVSHLHSGLLAVHCSIYGNHPHTPHSPSYSFPSIAKLKLPGALEEGRKI